jgi:hypothetical protein
VHVQWQGSNLIKLVNQEEYKGECEFNLSSRTRSGLTEGVAAFASSNHSRWLPSLRRPVFLDATLVGSSTRLTYRREIRYVQKFSV